MLNEGVVEMELEAYVQIQKRQTWMRVVVMTCLLLLFFIALIISIAIGPVIIPFQDTLAILLHKLHIPISAEYTEKQWVVITEVRLPRVLVAALVGAALALAGAAMQGLFRNPLVEPGFIGISSGAAFGAVVAIFFHLTTFSAWLLPLSAFLGALLAMFLIVMIWTFSRTRSIAMLLLLGIGMNAFFSALTNVLLVSSDTEQELRSAISWLQGGLEARSWEHVGLIILPIVLGSIILIGCSRSLNIMLLGEEQARSSGVHLKWIRNSILLFTALITGAAVAVSGIISFVGLVVPHMLRLLIGPDHQLLLPASMVGGASFLMFTDLLSRVILQPITLQVGVVSAMIGAPLFIFLIYRSGRRMGI